jgi:filamentous hemagglutinin
VHGLRLALLAHAQNNPVSGQFANSYGTRYEVSCSLHTPDGRDPCIISVWIIESQDPRPRFVTAYPNPQTRTLS